MTQDYRIMVSRGPSDHPGQEVTAPTAAALADLIGLLPRDGSVRVERVADQGEYAIACPLPTGACFIQYDDGRGRSAETERGGNAEAGQALHAWATRERGWERAFSWMHRYPVPERIPISHVPGYRTDLAGSWEGGQFLGGVYGVAYLHLFDHDGRHLSSQIGIPDTDDHPDEARLKAMVDALPGRRFGHIAIRPFRVEHGGREWGLFDQSEDYGFPHAELEPDKLGFGPPWDGQYDT